MFTKACAEIDAVEQARKEADVKRHDVSVEQNFQHRRRLAGLRLSVEERRGYVKQLDEASRDLEMRRDDLMRSVEEARRLQREGERQLEAQLARLHELKEAQGERIVAKTYPRVNWLPTATKLPPQSSSSSSSSSSPSSLDTVPAHLAPIPASALRRIFSYLSPVDVARSQLTCRGWCASIEKAGIWREATQLSLRLGSMVAKGPLQGEGQHEHFCLGIAIEGDAYLVTVESELVYDEVCLDEPTKGRTSSMEADQNGRGVVVTLCLLAAAGLKEERSFCKELMAAHADNTRIKLETAHLMAELDTSDSRKRVLDREMQAAGTLLNAIQTGINYAKLQHESDECTATFLEEALAKVETEAQLATAETMRLERAHRDEDQQLGVAQAGQVGAQVTGDTEGWQLQLVKLREDKALLTREVKSLQRQVDAGKGSRDLVIAEHLRLRQHIDFLRKDP
jgi:hypothetical protein